VTVRGSSQEAIYEVDGMEINDAPRYEHRGVMIDVARNFQSTSELLKLVDVLAMYKLNKLHLHLADDEGWRLQIPGLEELTEVIGFTLLVQNSFAQHLAIQKTYYECIQRPRSQFSSCKMSFCTAHCWQRL